MPEDIEESSVRSMTVNERLFHFGLFDNENKGQAPIFSPCLRPVICNVIQQI